MTRLADLIAGGVVRTDVPLGPFTTYKTGGPAALFATVNTPTDLTSLIDSGLTTEHPILVIGRGSNLVVSESGFAGLVIRPAGEFSTYELEGEKVTAGAAVPLPRLARSAVDAGLRGLEFFVGIPGSVGGAVRQNAGCFGTETKDVLVSATLIDLETGSTVSGDSQFFGLDYRQSNVRSNQMVISASFRGKPGDPEEGRAAMREITRWRKDHQPGGTLNAGSVFKNPRHRAAGELIDALGLKGTAVGDVSVSEKHANFFVAGPDASADDIFQLVNVIKDTVFERSGTMLEPEIQLVGFES